MQVFYHIFIGFTMEKVDKLDESYKKGYQDRIKNDNLFFNASNALKPAKINAGVAPGRSKI